MEFRQALVLLLGFGIGMHLAVFFHELGHALGHWLGGGRVSSLVMMAPLPVGHVSGSGASPRLSVWGGVAFGSVIGLAPLVASIRLAGWSLLRFAALMVTAFSFGHNALYLLVGSIEPFSDASFMIALGSPRWLLFVLSLPLLVGFVLVLTLAVHQAGIGPGTSLWKRIAVVEGGLLAVPAFMLLFALLSSSMRSLRTTMILLTSAYALCFAFVAARAGSETTSAKANVIPSALTKCWSPILRLGLALAVLILVEWLALRPR